MVQLVLKVSIRLQSSKVGRPEMWPRGAKNWVDHGSPSLATTSTNTQLLQIFNCILDYLSQLTNSGTYPAITACIDVCTDVQANESTTKIIRKGKFRPINWSCCHLGWWVGSLDVLGVLDGVHITKGKGKFWVFFSPTGLNDVFECIFMRDSIYAIARICHGNSVCPSVCHMGGSVKSVWS